MSDETERQKEAAFRAAFGNGGQEISVYGPVSTSVMQWGIDRGYVARVGDSAVYRLTDSGRAAVIADDRGTK